jgi:hypothetical protein
VLPVIVPGVGITEETERLVSAVDPHPLFAFTYIFPVPTHAVG